MAYQKTEKVKAHLAARKQLIVASAMDIIAKDGMRALTLRAVASRAGISTGLVYEYFPDMTELGAHVEATVTSRDVDAISEAAKTANDPVRAFAAAAGALFDRLSSAISREMMTHSEAYVLNVARALAHQIGASGLCERSEARSAAQATLGALFGMAAAEGQRAKRLSAAMLFVLKGIGASASEQRKAMETLDG